MLTKKIVERVGLALGVALFSGWYLLPPSSQGLFGSLLLSWLAMMVVFDGALKSSKTDSQLYAKVLLISVCLSGLVVLFYQGTSGSTTFDKRAGAGVVMFLRIYFGAVMGVYFATAVGRPLVHKRASPSSSNSPTSVTPEGPKLVPHNLATPNPRQDVIREELIPGLATMKSRVAAVDIELNTALQAGRHLRKSNRQREVFVGIHELQQVRDTLANALSSSSVKLEEIEQLYTLVGQRLEQTSFSLVELEEIQQQIPNSETTVHSRELQAEVKTAIQKVDLLIAEHGSQSELLSEFSSKILAKEQHGEISKRACALLKISRFADLDYSQLDRFTTLEDSRREFWPTVAAFGGFFVFIVSMVINRTNSSTEGRDSTIQLEDQARALVDNRDAPSIQFAHKPPVLGNSAPLKKALLSNTLDMKFVQVPGLQVYFCVHETRNMDYAKYAASLAGGMTSGELKRVLAKSGIQSFM